MKVNDVISTGLLETYVTGVASETEITQIKELCKKHPELNLEIEAIETALVNFSFLLGGTIDPAVKDKIFARLSFKKHVRSNDQRNIFELTPIKTKLFKFGIAAGLLLFISTLTFAILLQRKLTFTTSELALVKGFNRLISEDLKNAMASIANNNSKLEILSNPDSKKITLQGMNSLSSFSAAVHWNSKTNDIYFSAKALPTLNNKQYQLWAMVDGKAVDAGVINNDGTFVFQKMKPIAGVKTFAVTIENAGGKHSPSLETICLLGNV